MACYHFRLKTDKKPSGLRVSAIEHLSYIHRAGKYQNIDQRDLMNQGVKSYANYLGGHFPILSLPNHPVLLYNSPFGKIKLDAKGVHASDCASIETEAIALLVAQKIFGDELDVHGDARFERDVIGISRDLELGVHFTDIRLEQRNEEAKWEREEIEGQRTLAKGSAICAGRQNGNGFGFGADGRPVGGLDIQPDAARPAAESVEALARIGLRLRELPGGNVAKKSRHRHLLLRTDEDRELHNERGRRDAGLALRWTVSDARRRDAVKAADAILANLQKNVENDFAFAHLQYINREASFSMRGGVKAMGHHLPKWAKDSPLRFFHAADRFERANGERYKEIIFSLPNELSLEQQREIVDMFLAHHMENHYHAWAIHDKIGAMSDGERHPHVHLMFSTREIDAEERVRERPAERFFQRANPKNPAAGGCAKPARWRGKSRNKYLLEMREDYARIQNDVLEKYNVPVRVSHRCLMAQMLEASARGDDTLAEILDRLPEVPVSPTSIIRDDDIVREQKQLRRFNDQRLDRIMRRTLSRDAEEEKEAEDLLACAQEKYESMQREDLAALPLGHRSDLEKIKSELDAMRKEVHALAPLVMWGHSALEQARLDLMDEKGRAAWEEMTTLRKAMHEAKMLYGEIDIRFEMTEDEQLAATELNVAAYKNMQRLSKAYEAAARNVQPHLKQLSARGIHKQLQYRVNHYMFQNKFTKIRFQNCLDAYVEKLDAFHAKVAQAQNELLLQQEEADFKSDLALTMQQARRILSYAQKRHALRQTQLYKDVEEAKKQVLSYERIIQIAENIFENGGIKTLRERERKHKKTESYWKSDMQKLEADEAAFAREDAPGIFSVFGNAKREYEDEQQQLRCRRAALLEKAEALEKERAAIQSVREEIEARRNTGAAEKRIQQIAYGILKKNRPAVLRAKKLSAELAASYESSKLADDRIDAVDRQIVRGRAQTRCKPIPVRGQGGAPSCVKAAQEIGDALLHPAYASLIAKDKDERMDENWKLLSVMEQDEIIEASSHVR